ncbi:MAG: methanogenesis marker 2 protein, partial [Thermoplasmata archaeon]
GFVVTCKPDDSKEILRLYESVGLTAAVVGDITEDVKLRISDGKGIETLFDFEQEIITGCR